MKFTAVFEIGPEAGFGLPEDGMTVLPASPGDYVGDSYDTWTGTKASHGTLSAYRALDQAVQADLRVADSSVRFNDNFATIEQEADNAGEAYRKAINCIDRLLQHLSLTQGRVFEFRPVSLVSEDRQESVFGPVRVVGISRDRFGQRLIERAVEPQDFGGVVRVRDPGQ